MIHHIVKESLIDALSHSNGYELMKESSIWLVVSYTETMSPIADVQNVFGGFQLVSEPAYIQAYKVLSVCVLYVVLLYFMCVTKDDR